MDRRQFVVSGLLACAATPLAAQTPAQGVRYSALRDAFVAGQTYFTRSVRLDLDAGRAEVATVSSGGRIQHLSQHALRGGLVPNLPMRTYSVANRWLAPDVSDLVSPAFGLAARVGASGRDRIVAEPAVQSSLRFAPAAWSIYDDSLRDRVGREIGRGGSGTYLRLVALDGRYAADPAFSLTRGDLDGAPIWNSLFGSLFAMVPRGTSAAPADAALVQMVAGQRQTARVAGRSYEIGCFTL